MQALNFINLPRVELLETYTVPVAILFKSSTGYNIVQYLEVQGITMLGKARGLCQYCLSSLEAFYWVGRQRWHHFQILITSLRGDFSIIM